MSGAGPARQWSAHQIARNVIRVDVDIPSLNSEQWILLTSDEHWDNAGCDRAMFKKHLDECRERGGLWISNGDLFCAMQGKWDRRADQDQLRPEHRGNRYLDALVETAADWLEPYADICIGLGHGNHETAMLRHHQTDLTERLLALLNARCGTDIRCHGYSGWVLLRGRRCSQTKTLNLLRHHGHGGGAPVTRGVIQTNRRAVDYPDANIVVEGHNHQSWIVEVPRVRITSGGRVYHDEQLHVRVPGYKDEVGDGFGGWAVERAHSPTPKGAVWLRLWWDTPRWRKGVAGGGRGGHILRCEAVKAR